jgi:xylulokinase
MVGGGAQSPLWCQIFADTLDREVHQIDQPLLAQLRGVALLAGPALGHHSLNEIPVPKATVFEPSGDGRGTREYARDIKGLYERDKNWSRRRAKAR